MPVSFDGPNLRITLTTVEDYDAQADLYSEWKRWALLSDNAKFPPAFDTTGGDPIGAGQTVAPYFFLRTDLGWVIRAPEAEGEIVVDGNLYPRNAGDALFEQPVGDFTVLITQALSSRAVVVETGVSGLTAEESTRLTTLEARMAEIWQLRGLDAANPATITPTQETAGSIELAISGDGVTSSTLTRQ